MIWELLLIMNVVLAVVCASAYIVGYADARNSVRKAFGKDAPMEFTYHPSVLFMDEYDGQKVRLVHELKDGCELNGQHHRMWIGRFDDGSEHALFEDELSF